MTPPSADKPRPQDHRSVTGPTPGHPRPGGFPMNRRLGGRVVGYYELRVEGHLDDYWGSWFVGMALTREDDGTTTLRGFVADQAALHGLIARVGDIGAFLISVKTTDRPDGAGEAGSAPGPP